MLFTCKCCCTALMRRSVVYPVHSCTGSLQRFVPGTKTLKKMFGDFLSFFPFRPCNFFLSVSVSFSPFSHFLSCRQLQSPDILSRKKILKSDFVLDLYFFFTIYLFLFIYLSLFIILSTDAQVASFRFRNKNFKIKRLFFFFVLFCAFFYFWYPIHRGNLLNILSEDKKRSIFFLFSYLYFSLSLSLVV